MLNDENESYTRALRDKQSNRELIKSLNKVTKMLKESENELQVLKKKDRFFNIQKKCIEEASKKANMYHKKLSQVENTANNLQNMNSELQQEKEQAATALM